MNKRIHGRWPLTPSGFPKRTDPDWRTLRDEYQSALDRWYITWLAVIVGAFLLTFVASAVAA